MAKFSIRCSFDDHYPNVEHISLGWWVAAPFQPYVSRPRTLSHKRVESKAVSDRAVAAWLRKYSEYYVCFANSSTAVLWRATWRFFFTVMYMTG